MIVSVKFRCFLNLRRVRPCFLGEQPFSRLQKFGVQGPSGPIVRGPFPRGKLIRRGFWNSRRIKTRAGMKINLRFPQGAPILAHLSPPGQIPISFHPSPRPIQAITLKTKIKNEAGKRKKVVAQFPRLHYSTVSRFLRAWKMPRKKTLGRDGKERRDGGESLAGMDKG